MGWSLDSLSKRKELKAAKKAKKRAAHPSSAARIVGCTELKPICLLTSTKLILEHFTHNKDFRNHQKRLQPTETLTKQIPDKVKIQLCGGTELSRRIWMRCYKTFTDEN